MNRQSLAIQADIDALRKMAAIPTILLILNDLTGMRLSAVARVVDSRWIACAVQDDLGFGLMVGDEVPLDATLCLDAKASRRAIVLDDVSSHPFYRDHPAPKASGARSYVTAPIVLADGEYFGNVCSVDTEPARFDSPRVLSIFQRVAKLIGAHIESERGAERARRELDTAREAERQRVESSSKLGEELGAALGEIASRAAAVARADSAAQARQIAEGIKDCAERMALRLR